MRNFTIKIDEIYLSAMRLTAAKLAANKHLRAKCLEQIFDLLVQPLAQPGRAVGVEETAGSSKVCNIFLP